MIATPTATLAEFLAELYADAVGPERVLVVWSKDEEALGCTSVDQAAAEIQRRAERANVYFGCALQDPAAVGNGKRGPAESARAIAAVWIDFDVGTLGHKRNDNPPALEVALQVLRSALPIEPSAIVSSGGGLQVWYFLREVWIFADDDERQEAARLVAGIQETLRASLAKHGWGLDSTADLARVLRAPGTWNRKLAEPRPVQLLSWRPEVRFNPDDLAQYAAELDVAPSTNGKHVAVPAPGSELSELARALLDAILVSNSFFRDAWENRKSWGDTSSSGCAFTIARQLIRTYPDLPDEPIVELIAHRRRELGQPEKRADWYARTVERARKSAEDKKSAPAPDSASEIQPPEPSPNGNGVHERILASAQVVRERAVERFNPTDLGNGERLKHRFGEDMRHCASLGGWHIFDGKRFAKDETGQADRRAKATVRAIFEEAAPIKAKLKELEAKIISGEGENTEQGKAMLAEAKKLEAEKNRIYAHAIKSEQEPRVRAMLSRGAVEHGIAVRARDFDADDWLLNVENGTLDLRTGELREYRRADLLTKLAPTVFDPDAKCAAWDDFLDLATDHNADRRTFLQKFAGLALTGDTSEDVVGLLDGPGASGKTTFVEALKAALGDYALTIPFEALLETDHGGGARPEIAKLPGARLVIANEVEAGRNFNAALLKALAGGDIISARNLYRDPFEFSPRCKLLLVANDLPHVKADDSGAWRRFRRVLFPNAIPAEKRDPKLRERLREPDARAGVMAWMFAGLQMRQRDGLGLPATIESDTAALRERKPTGIKELVERFVAECCVKDPGAKESNAVLYATFVLFAEAQSVPLVSADAFGCALTRELKFETIPMGKGRGKAGLRVRAEGVKT